MQYYINLSTANNLLRIQKTSKRQTGRSAMVNVESANDERIKQQQQQQQQQQRDKPKKSEKSVTFSIKSQQFVVSEETMEMSNHSVRSRELTPREDDEDRQFDLVIFAASGCVGKFLVEEMALVVDKHFNNNNRHQSNSSPPSSLLQQQFAQQALRRRSVPSSSDDGLRWAVAGRSAIKLSETLCRAELSTGIQGLSSSIPVILADLNHQKSLIDMCQKSRLIINCAGPYSELGAEILIRTCIEARTNYIDLAHEVTFVERMRQHYSDKAKEAKVFILNGCGFQSMSAEMGLNFTKQVADGTIEQIKIILSMSDTCALIKSPCRQRQRASGIISEGMWNSLLAEKAQEISVEDRLRAKIAAREHETHYELMQDQQVHNEKKEKEAGDEEARQKLLEASQGLEDRRPNSSHSQGGNSKPRTAAHSTSSSSTSSLTTGNLVSTLSSQTKSLTARILERKDTQSLVKDIVQFRNRSVSLAWPLRLIQGFQGRSGRGYCWPIDNMSSDESQLIRSEMNNYELRRPDLDCDEGWRPIRCSTFLSVKNFTQLSMLFVWLFVFQILVKFSLFRYAMRKFPQLATLGHVASSSSSSSCGLGQRQSTSGGGGGCQQSIERDSLSHIKFCQTFIAYGRPSGDSGDPLESHDKRSARKQVQLLVSRVVGPEPNHVAAATFAIQAAMTLLTERDHLPCSGGVLTPGAAFSETNIIYQLRKRNIKFEVLKKA